MAVTRVGIASQPFLYLDFCVICVFEAVAIDSIGIWDDVVCTSVDLASREVVDFFS